MWEIPLESSEILPSDAFASSNWAEGQASRSEGSAQDPSLFGAPLSEANGRVPISKRPQHREVTVAAAVAQESSEGLTQGHC